MKTTATPEPIPVSEELLLAGLLAAAQTQTALRRVYAPSLRAAAWAIAQRTDPAATSWTATVPRTMFQRNPDPTKRFSTTWTSEPVKISTIEPPSGTTVEQQYHLHDERNSTARMVGLILRIFLGLPFLPEHLSALYDLGTKSLNKPGSLDKVLSYAESCYRGAPPPFLRPDAPQPSAPGSSALPARKAQETTAREPERDKQRAVDSHAAADAAKAEAEARRLARTAAAEEKRKAAALARTGASA